MQNHFFMFLNNLQVKLRITKILFSIVFVMGDFTLTLLKNIKKK